MWIYFLLSSHFFWFSFLSLWGSQQRSGIFSSYLFLFLSKYWEAVEGTQSRICDSSWVLCWLYGQMQTCRTGTGQKSWGQILFLFFIAFSIYNRSYFSLSLIFILISLSLSFSLQLSLSLFLSLSLSPLLSLSLSRIPFSSLSLPQSYSLSIQHTQIHTHIHTGAKNRRPVGQYR